MVVIFQEGELGEAKTRQEVYLVAFLTQELTVCVPYCLEYNLTVLFK